MAVFERGEVSLHYEVFGDGFPILLFAPGGMRSAIPFPDYVQSSARSGGLTRAAVFLGSRASLPADGARSVAFASLPRAGSPRSQEADGPSCRSPDENCA